MVSRHENAASGSATDWEAVEAVKAKELAAMTDVEARRIIRSLRLFAPAPANPLNGLGLVAQQAIFRRRPRE